MTKRPNPGEWAFHAGDAAVLHALETGQHEASLREFFGLDAYTDLTALAAQAAQVRSRRAKRRGASPPHRVLILPGIMGSKLGRARTAGATSKVLWIDPLRIAAGQLTQLALPRGAGLQPLGVMLFTYAKIKLMLDIAGFDARFHAYDWRLSLSDLGTQLAERILKEDRPVSVVAHSMGGLVARAALGLLPKRSVRRAVLIGVPNAGTYAPVQALCGTYPAVRKIATLDLKHSVEFLAKHVFSSFPGLYQLLPAPDPKMPVNVYDPGAWPRPQSHPDVRLLKQAMKARDALAPPDERFAQIVGIGQDTIVGIHRFGGGFGYDLKPAGDGTVPLASALLPGVPAYYVAELHGSLTNHSQVIHCAAELIKTGRGRALPQRWTQGRTRTRAVTDHQLRTQFQAKVDWRKLDSAGRERLMTQFSGNTGASASKPRRKIELRIAYGNIADADGSALVLGIFRNVTPGGAALAVDQRLNGAIREFTARRMFSGEAGQIFAMPAGSRRLRAKSVVFAGMGDFDRFDAQTQSFVSENVVRTLAHTRMHDFVTVLFGTGSGVSVADAVANQLRGYFHALDAADASYELRRITFCVYDQRRLRQLRTALRTLIGGEIFTDVDATLSETTLRAMPKAVLGKPRPSIPTTATPAPPTAYLILSQEPGLLTDDRICVRSSLLSAGAKAAVLSSRQAIRRHDLDALLDDLHGGEFHERDLKRYGERLGVLMLHHDMREALLQSKASHLAVVHDAAMSQLPWETLSIGAWTPAMAAGVSRRYAAENLSVARWSETRRMGETLEVLLVANPTQDLPGAQAEAQRLIRVFAGRADIRLHVVQGAQATRARLLNDFRSGAFDVLHYAGHAHFDEREPQRSGIVCAKEEILSGSDLAALQSLPALVFFNACESGRLRAARPGRRIRRALAATDGLAESFLRGGVANYLGTYWPVGDDAALAFSTALYSSIVAGNALGYAINRARAAVRAAHSCDWADYMHYGSYEFAIKGP